MDGKTLTITITNISEFTHVFFDLHLYFRFISLYKRIISNSFTISKDT